MADRRMQIDAPMGLIAMKVEGDARNRELHHEERREDVAPQTEVEDAVEIFH